MRPERLTFAAVVLLPVLVMGADAAETLTVGGTVQPDAQIQEALKRLIRRDRPMDLTAVDELAKLSGARSPDFQVRKRAWQHLAEQLFLFSVREKLAVEGYDLFLIKNGMRILQGTMYVPNSAYVAVAAPNIGHEDRIVSETAVWILEMLGANVPVKERGTGEYHFRQLEQFLEDIHKLGFVPEEEASSQILGMYATDAEAALNTMVRVKLRSELDARDPQVRVHLRVARECVARIRFALSVGPDSEAAGALNPTAGVCLETLAASPHWYVRVYVPFIFLEEEALIDARLLDRLAEDPHPVVRQGVRNVRDAWQRREAEKAAQRREAEKVEQRQEAEKARRAK